MKFTKSVFALGVALTMIGSGAVLTAADKDDARLTITGCVVAGEAKDTFMVTDVLVGGADLALVPAGAFYRLDSTKGLKEHVGHRVEISGTADFGDLDKGTLKVKTDAEGKTTASLNSERRTVTAEVNTNSSVVPAAWAGSEGSLKAAVATYKFKMSGIKTIGTSCR